MIPKRRHKADNSAKVEIVYDQSEIGLNQREKLRDIAVYMNDDLKTLITGKVRYSRRDLTRFLDEPYDNDTLTIEKASHWFREKGSVSNYRNAIPGSEDFIDLERDSGISISQVLMYHVHLKLGEDELHYDTEDSQLSQGGYPASLDNLPVALKIKGIDGFVCGDIWAEPGLRDRYRPNHLLAERIKNPKHGGVLKLDNPRYNPIVERLLKMEKKKGLGANYIGLPNQQLLINKDAIQNWAFASKKKLEMKDAYKIKLMNDIREYENNLITDRLVNPVRGRPNRY